MARGELGGDGAHLEDELVPVGAYARDGPPAEESPDADAAEPRDAAVVEVAGEAVVEGGEVAPRGQHDAAAGGEVYGEVPRSGVEGVAADVGREQAPREAAEAELVVGGGGAGAGVGAGEREEEGRGEERGEGERREEAAGLGGSRHFCLVANCEMGSRRGGRETWSGGRVWTLEVAVGAESRDKYRGREKVKRGGFFFFLTNSRVSSHALCNLQGKHRDTYVRMEK